MKLPVTIADEAAAIQVAKAELQRQYEEALDHLSRADLEPVPGYPDYRPMMIVCVEEVPCGWAIWYTNQKIVDKSLAEGDGEEEPILLGGYPLLINRWTGKPDKLPQSLVPTWRAAVRLYMSRLPQKQRDECNAPVWCEKWVPDPIEFDPPLVDLDVEGEWSHSDVFEVTLTCERRFTDSAPEQTLMVDYFPMLLYRPDNVSYVHVVREVRLVSAKWDLDRATFVYAVTLKPRAERTREGDRLVIVEEPWMSEELSRETSFHYLHIDHRKDFN